jgi:hypothetical protein
MAGLEYGVWLHVFRIRTSKIIKTRYNTENRVSKKSLQALSNVLPRHIRSIKLLKLSKIPCKGSVAGLVVSLDRIAFQAQKLKK